MFPPDAAGPANGPSSPGASGLVVLAARRAGMAQDAGRWLLAGPGGYPQVPLTSEVEPCALKRPFLIPAVPPSSSSRTSRVEPQPTRRRGAALFLKAVLEIRRGRRLVMLNPDSEHPACELAMPTLSALEWAAKREKLSLSADALAKVQELIGSKVKPGARLRAATKRHRR